MRAALVAALLLLAMPAGAAAAPELMKLGRFSEPVALAAPPGDGSRLFVAERGGTVRLLKHGVPAPAPFADLTSKVRAGGERGLLGIAFAPDYAASGRAYVFLTAKSPAGELQIRELRRSSDPDRARRGPGRLVLGVPHPDATHNGGQLAFGPDGLLYAATGDGGGSNDLEDDAADTGSLLGKILRIDPRKGAAQPDNPFGNAVWSYGLRNPWRFSFDRTTGDLVIGDVGQGVKEEIDWAPAVAGRGRGVNFGWHCWEGTIATPFNPNDRSSSPLCRPALRPLSQPPALERDHDADGFCAIVGGFVVRDPGLPSLTGRYLYGDNCHSGLESVVLGGPGGPVDVGVSVPALTSFGEDACGRIYTASFDGAVSRLQDGVPSACGARPDTRAPALSVARRARARLSRLRLDLRADEDCTVTLRARHLRTRRVGVKAGVRRSVRLIPTRDGRRRLRRALARNGGSLRITLRIAARDAGGNVQRRRARLGVRS